MKAKAEGGRQKAEVRTLTPSPAPLQGEGSTLPNPAVLMAIYHRMQEFYREQAFIVRNPEVQFTTKGTKAHEGGKAEDGRQMAEGSGRKAVRV